MGAILGPFLIYWLVMFVTSYIAVEVGQDQFYDGVTPLVGPKVAAGSLLLAVLTTWLRPSYESMFTTGVAWTVLQGIVWFGVFTLIYQFHPQHALAIGIPMMLLIPGLATLGVDSMTKPTPIEVTRPRGRSEPLRKPLSGGAAPPPVVAPPAKK
jgi:hypothetical protein